MKNITLSSLEKSKIITTVLYTHFVKPDDKIFRGTTTELIVRTNIITKEVVFTVTHNHFEESFDNILDATICYNNYN